MRIGYLIIAILLGLALILAIQYRDRWLGGWGLVGGPPPAIVPQVTLRDVTPPLVLPRPEPVEAPAAAAEPPPPALDESDTFVRDQLASFAAPEPWRAQNELARRLAVVLASAADGTLPRDQLAFLAPADAFPTQPVGDDEEAFLLDAEGYARFQPTVEAMLSVPPEAMAAIFQRVEPLLTDAVAELGERRPVRELLNEALQQVLTTPELDQRIVLKRPSVAYEFADPELEALTDLQKQLLRMGPQQLTRLKAYARQTAEVLNSAALEAGTEASTEAP